MRYPVATPLLIMGTIFGLMVYAFLVLVFT